MDGHDDLFESRTGAVRVARFGAVFAGIYRAPLIAEAFEELRVWQGPVMPDEPIAQFSLAFGVHRLAPEVQAAADRVLTAYGPRTCVSATVLVASGFQAVVPFHIKPGFSVVKYCSPLILTHFSAILNCPSCVNRT